MEQDGRNERGAIGDQEAHIRQLEAENRELRRANEILKTPSAPRDACPADLVNRRFVARGLNELWVADIPYVRAQVGWVCVSFATNVCSRRILGWQVSSLTRTDLSHPRGPEADDHVDDVVGLPGPGGGIDNVYGPAGRIYSTTTAELDGKRREPGSNPYPAPAGPPRRAPEHHSPSTEPSTFHRPTPILTDNHNGYTQTIRRVLRY